MELTLVSQSESESMSRPFNCATCPSKIQKLRRCHEDRWDFTMEDATIFPMQVSKGGQLYGFCPGKSTWDFEVKSLFSILMLSAETGQLYQSGGIINQPEWFISLLTDFIPVYDKIKFMNKAKMILGDGKSQKRPAVQGKSNKVRGR